MKKTNLLVLGLGLAVSGLVNAAGYGVIDLEKVVANSQYLKQQNASLEQSVKPQTVKLEQINKDIESIRQKAQAQGANKDQLEAQYKAKVTEFQTIQQGVQAKVQSTIQNTNKTFEERVKQVSEQLRQENGLDMVLNKNAVLSYDPKFDLTDKMTQKVNAIK